MLHPDMMKKKASFALIGDLIGSRQVADRAGLHTRLHGVLAAVNERFAPVTPLRVTVGDEYQGVFPSLGTALQATLVLRLALLPEVDVRHGIGAGELGVLQEEPRVEDGPAWWVARDAIVAVEEGESRGPSRTLRTSYAVAAGAVEGLDGVPDPALVNAALVLRDQLVAGASERSLSVLRGLLESETQREVAARLGISPSAVSQRVRADGLGAIVTAHELLGGL